MENQKKLTGFNLDLKKEIEQAEQEFADALAGKIVLTTIDVDPSKPLSPEALKEIKKLFAKSTQ